MAFASMASRLWVALPGIVETFNAAKMTVEVQPATNGKAFDQNGESKPLQMPKLVDVPVLWQGGGGATLTFPIKAGDECLVIFASRCIDAWWSQGGVQDSPELRMHNLSDGFAIVGVRCAPRAFAVDTTWAMLRADDGSTFVKLDPAGQLVTLTAPGGINLNGVTIDSAGNLHSPATIDAATDVVTNHVSLKGHPHSGVTVGAANSGGPVGTV